MSLVEITVVYDYIYIYLCDLFLLDFSFVVQTCAFKLDHPFGGF